MSDSPELLSGALRGLLDTSALIHSERVQDLNYLPHEPLISAITLAELSVGPHVAATSEERILRQAQLQQVEADLQAIPFDAAAARVFGRISAELRANGRKPAARKFDALISAVAIANQLPLYTCNPKDFAGISGLDLVAVPYPDQS